ncbi:hypothetical protein E2P30_00765 [Candidatus Bathyarchaeota archaeon]|nr:hypothetical protein E2P30_00765 [Candidatus Bathyarchaeota archaeon]
MERTKIPIHKDIMIHKEVLPQLPSCFKHTKLGYPRKGVLAQYRGPNAIHVHEYPRYWLFHRDHGDPRTFRGVLAHLLFDAPEIPLSVLAGSVSGIAVAKIVGEIRKNRSKNAGEEAIIAGSIASLSIGAITFLLGRKK